MADEYKDCRDIGVDKCTNKTGCEIKGTECVPIHKCQEDGFNDMVYVRVPPRSIHGQKRGTTKRSTETNIWYVPHEKHNTEDGLQIASKVIFDKERLGSIKQDTQRHVSAIPESDVVVFPEQNRVGFIYPIKEPTRWRMLDYAIGAAFSVFFVLGFVSIIYLTVSMLRNPVNLRYGYVESTLKCSDSEYAAELQNLTLKELNDKDKPQNALQEECMRKAKNEQILGIKSREATRATAASFICSIVFSTLNSALDATCKINPATSTALVGMMMNGTVGFLLDNAMGQDTAFQIWQEDGVGPAIRYAFAQLDVVTSPKFIRYIVSILFDIFITVILFKPLYGSLIKRPFFRCGETPRAMANGLVSAFIAMITFQAYANNMRLNWAYPSKMILEAEKQQPGTILNGTTMLIATVIMSMIYLNTETRINPAAAKEGINDPSWKRGIVFIVLLIVAGLSKSNYLNPSIDEDSGSEEDLDTRSNRGFGIFCGIVAFAIGGTLYTSERLNTMNKMVAWVLIVLAICATFFMLKTWKQKVGSGNTKERELKATLAHDRWFPATLLFVSALVIASPLIVSACRSAARYWTQLSRAFSRKSLNMGLHTLSFSLLFFALLFFSCTIVLIYRHYEKNREDDQTTTNILWGVFAVSLLMCVRIHIKM